MSFTTVSQPQTRLGGVAEPSENASRLIADAQPGSGSRLVLEVVGFDREQTVGVRSARLWWLVVCLLQIADDPD